MMSRFPFMNYGGGTGALSMYPSLGVGGLGASPWSNMAAAYGGGLGMQPAAAFGGGGGGLTPYSSMLGMSGFYGRR